MKRRWKFLGLFLIAIAALAVVNTFVTNDETEPAKVTVEGAEILSLPGGDLQVLDLPASEPDATAGAVVQPPIVLIHGYTASMNWWQDVIPELSRKHRVIAIDLLGHGGSAKPSSGYSVPGQADLIAQALNQLGAEGAVVVGHSLGGAVATALTERSSELVDRLVIMDMAPDVENFGNLDLMSRISRMPVIGQAIKRVTPDSLLRRGLEQGFAPGFPVPDYAVEDLKRMTYTAYHDWPPANESFTEERPLDQRVESSFTPLLVVFGAEDQIFDARTSLSAYAAVPGARTEMLEGVGHSPQVEAPEQTAALIRAFAEPPPPPPARAKKKPKSAQAKRTAATKQSSKAKSVKAQSAKAQKSAQTKRSAKTKQ